MILDVRIGCRADDMGADVTNSSHRARRAPRE
jgi:hypothetical protein